MLTLLLAMNMARTVVIILILILMMTNYIEPEMDRHDGANTQEEPFNLSQRLSALSDNDIVTLMVTKLMMKGMMIDVDFFIGQSGDEAVDLGTKEAQAFFCFTKIMATWTGLAIVI